MLGPTAGTAYPASLYKLVLLDLGLPPSPVSTNAFFPIDCRFCCRHSHSTAGAKQEDQLHARSLVPNLYLETSRPTTLPAFFKNDSVNALKLSFRKGLGIRKLSPGSRLGFNQHQEAFVMHMYTVGHSRIVSTGAYIPEQRITSRQIMEEIESEDRFGIPRDWLERTTGIREKRVASDHMLPSDMASIAAREAMEIGGVRPSDIDVVIYAGMDRDYLVEPATAHAVQDKIKAQGAVAFDVTNACHGFMNGIHLMDALIATGQARRGLVVTGEQGSRHTRKTIEAMRQTIDREKFAKLVGGLTLGDAGAAMIMGPKLGPDTGFMGFMLQSQGQYAALCTCGRRNEEPLLLEIDMPAIVERGIAMLGEMYDALMQKLGWKPEEISQFLHHQVGLKVFKRHAAYAKISLDIMPKTVSEHGNLITANLPFSLHNSFKNQSLRTGDKVFLSGAGSGISISQAGLIWDAA